MSKPHKGVIVNWRKETEDCAGLGLGYLIMGVIINHPDCTEPTYGNTSYVVRHDTRTGHIETKNSRYTLVGPAQVEN